MPEIGGIISDIMDLINQCRSLNPKACTGVFRPDEEIPISSFTPCLRS